MTITDPSSMRVHSGKSVESLDRSQGTFGKEGHSVELGVKIDSLRASTVRTFITSLVDGLRSLSHRLFGPSDKAVDVLKNELELIASNDDISPLDYSSGKPDIIAGKLKEALKGEIGLPAKMKMLRECSTVIDDKVKTKGLTELQGKQLKRMLLDVLFDEMSSWGMHVDLEDVYSALTVGQMKALLGEEAFEDYHGKDSLLDYPPGRGSVIRDLDKYDDTMLIGETDMNVSKLMQRLDTKGDNRLHISQVVNRLDIDTVVKLVRFDSLQEEGNFVSTLGRLHEKDSAHEAPLLRPAVQLIQGEIAAIAEDNRSGAEEILSFEEGSGLWDVQTNFEKTLHRERSVMEKLKTIEESVDLINEALSDGKITKEQAKGLKSALLNAFYDSFCAGHELSLLGDLSAKDVIGMMSLESVKANLGEGIDELPKGYKENVNFLNKWISDKELPLHKGAENRGFEKGEVDLNFILREGIHAPMGCEVLPLIGAKRAAELINRGSDPLVVGVLNKLLD
ncbi:MAG: hypothetical protein Tsb0018_10110 [Opitutales bacterium]